MNKVIFLSAAPPALSASASLVSFLNTCTSSSIKFIISESESLENIKFIRIKKYFYQYRWQLTDLTARQMTTQWRLMEALVPKLDDCRSSRIQKERRRSKGIKNRLQMKLSPLFLLLLDQREMFALNFR